MEQRSFELNTELTGCPMTNTRDLAAIPRNEKGIEVVSDFFKSLNFGQ